MELTQQAFIYLAVSFFSFVFLLLDVATPPGTWRLGIVPPDHDDRLLGFHPFLRIVGSSGRVEVALGQSLLHLCHHKSCHLPVVHFEIHRTNGLEILAAPAFLICGALDYHRIDLEQRLPSFGMEKLGAAGDTA